MPTEQGKTGIVRDEKGRIVAGSKSLNPGGRPKGISAYLMSKTNDMEDVADKMVEIFRNEKEGTKLWMFAASWISDYTLGKATQHIQTEDVTPEPIKFTPIDNA